MKLLFVYKFCTMGGVEVLLRARLEELLKRRIQAKILFLENFGGQGLFNALEQHILITSNSKLIAKLLDKDFDFILSIDTPQVYPIYREVNPRARFVYEVHTTYPANLAYLSGIEAQKLTALIVPSEFQKLLVQAFVNDHLPVFIVPNCLHPVFLSGKNTSPESLGLKPILWVGRLDEHKNWQEYLQLASILLHQRRDIEFWLVGGAQADQAQKEKLLIMVKELGLISHFRWLPQVHHENMPALYSSVGQSGGCLVLTSRNESFGMSVIEAMACRCPVVSPLVGALGELVVDGMTGKTYLPTNLSHAAETVCEILDNRAVRTRIVETAYRQVIQRFTPHHVVEQLLSILEELANLAPRR